MTLFFIDRDTARGIGKRILDDPHRLVSVSDVVVLVAKDDEWITTVDRHNARGLFVPTARRAKLLENYYTVCRPNQN
jgi:hypothetical protein